MEEELAYTNELTDSEAAAIFKICHIDHLLKRWTDELSGGEKQRIVTARALIASPKLLLLDEPFSNLDMTHKQMMKTVIAGITEKLKITCILISHDPLDTLSWADEILILQNGELLQRGTPARVYLQPLNEYVASLFGKYNLLNATQAKLFGLPVNEKTIMARPEHFKINEKQVTGSVKGIIKKSTFYGSYFDLDVLVEEVVLVVRTISCNMVENDIVYISVNDHEFCYF
ncbi:MAG: ATP-binding cassette domain-containing protein [Ferruginibacter sp.]